MTLGRLQELMRANGVNQLLAKELAPNDNSKNQPYLGGDFQTLSILPVGDIRAERTENGRETLKAPVSFWWLQPDATMEQAPGAQIILYPQYPEIRLSGFLRGTRNAPNELMNTRLEGRLMFLGVTPSARVVAWVVGPDSALAREFCSLRDLEQTGVFWKLPLTGDEEVPPKARLLSELRRIHERDWIDSYALRSDGSFAACNAPQCVGYTLEAELGVARNGYAEPDFLGWEVKASQVPSFATPSASKVLTLMTPEPTGGHYRDSGVESFIRRFGYEDRRGREDRLNFGGIFRAGSRHDGTGLTLAMEGYDAGAQQITNASGALSLLTDEGYAAASWSFPTLAKLWNTKHAQAVYVPAECRTDPARAYRYGSRIRLGEGTDFLKLLAAVSEGKVYYDPGIKMENASTARPRIKRRSQFRIRSGDLETLYSAMTEVDTTVQ
jgi:hypothetical protein